MVLSPSCSSTLHTPGTFYAFTRSFRSANVLASCYTVTLILSLFFIVFSGCRAPCCFSTFPLALYLCLRSYVYMCVFCLSQFNRLIKWNVRKLYSTFTTKASSSASISTITTTATNHTDTHTLLYCTLFRTRTLISYSLCE